MLAVKVHERMATTALNCTDSAAPCAAGLALLLLNQSQCENCVYIWPAPTTTAGEPCVKATCVAAKLGVAILTQMPCWHLIVTRPLGV